MFHEKRLFKNNDVIFTGSIRMLPVDRQFPHPRRYSLCVLGSSGRQTASPDAVPPCSRRAFLLTQGFTCEFHPASAGAGLHRHAATTRRRTQAPQPEKLPDRPVRLKEALAPANVFHGCSPCPVISLACRKMSGHPSNPDVLSPQMLWSDGGTTRC